MVKFLLIREPEGAETTISGWRLGKATLKPGIDLVGKVWKEWKTDQDFDQKNLFEQIIEPEHRIQLK